MIAMILAFNMSLSLQEAAKMALVIETEAKQANIDPLLVAAIIKTESGFRPKVTGALGEVGLMQLRPEFHPKVTHNIKNNITLGIKYLAKIRDICYPKYEKAWVVCYNGGPYIKLKHPKKFAYFIKVNESYEQIKESMHTWTAVQE